MLRQLPNLLRVGAGLLAACAILGPALALDSATPLAFDPAIEEDGGECTIAVITGAATADGRPILWKNRDTAYSSNEVVFFKEGESYTHVSLTNSGDLTQVWLGVNERGLAILNALSYNLNDGLSTGITNGQLMKHALEICGTVDEFETYLEVTDAIGRPNPSNIAVIDAKGGAAIFEAGNLSFVRFDATDSEVAPEGFLVRANFSLSADTSWSDTYRYNRCRSLLHQMLAGKKIKPADLLDRVGRDLRSVEVDPYPLPYEDSWPGEPGSYGHVSTVNTINRRLTVSGGAVVGVLPGEDPFLSTFYAVLGPPIVTMPLPVWVGAGQTPPELDGPDGSPLCNAAQGRNASLYDYPSSSGLLNTFRLVGPDGHWLDLAREIETWIYRETDAQIQRWRKDGIDFSQMALFERRTAQDAFACYMGGTRSRQIQPVALAAGPNPMKESTFIRLTGIPPAAGDWAIEVFDVAGRQVARLAAEDRTLVAGRGFRWDGIDGHGQRVPAGVYYIRAPELPGSPHASLVVVR